MTGEVVIRDTILLKKYQLIRILGQGRNGTVYLALHLELEEYRAIKRVPKSAACYEQFRKEALLLKRLHHPGIPMVYDLEEDDQFSYLIEEYLEGDSFYDLVKKRGPLNRDAVVRYGIQICDLVHYLHSAETIPILYLDLQPRNLLVCHGQVKLLDFDHSDTLTDANEADERFGTEGFTAPEQLDGEPLGVYTDVYQIGAVLCFLITGSPQDMGTAESVSGPLGAVLHRCLRHDAKARYASAAEVGEALKDLYSDTERTPLTIALAGARRGAGVTHIAIGLTAWLNQAGHPTLYDERSRADDVRAMGEFWGLTPDSFGIYTFMGIPARPRYGEAVRLKACGYPITVRDYGTEWKALARDRDNGEISCLVLVCGGKWWDWRQEEEAIAHLRNPAESMGGPPEASSSGPAVGEGSGTPDMVFLYNHAVLGAVRKREGRRGGRCLRVPEFSDPFHLGDEACSFFRTLSAVLLPDGAAGKPGVFRGKGGLFARLHGKGVLPARLQRKGGLSGAFHR